MLTKEEKSFDHEYLILVLSVLETQSLRLLKKQENTELKMEEEEAHIGSKGNTIKMNLLTNNHFI